jgi:hypothetical protein
MSYLPIFNRSCFASGLWVELCDIKTFYSYMKKPK